MFSIVDGEFVITNKFSFESVEILVTFRRRLGESDYYFELSNLRGELSLYLRGQDLCAFTCLDADYGTLDDYKNQEGDITSERPRSFGEILIRKAVEQHIAKTEPKKRRFAS